MVAIIGFAIAIGSSVFTQGVQKDNGHCALNGQVFVACWNPQAGRDMPKSYGQYPEFLPSLEGWDFQINLPYTVSTRAQPSRFRTCDDRRHRGRGESVRRPKCHRSHREGLGPPKQLDLDAFGRPSGAILRTLVSALVVRRRSPRSTNTSSSLVSARTDALCIRGDPNRPETLWLHAGTAIRY
jgi:hypothetical protein